MSLPIEALPGLAEAAALAQSEAGWRVLSRLTPTVPQSFAETERRLGRDDAGRSVVCAARAKRDRVNQIFVVAVDAPRRYLPPGKVAVRRSRPLRQRASRLRWGWYVVILVTTTALVGCGDDEEPSASSGDQTSSPVAETLTVQAGINDPQDPNIAVTEFLPEAVTIVAGKSVEWRIPGPEPHSVTFFPAGQQPPPPGSDQSLFAPKPSTGPFDGKSLINSGLVPLGPVAAPPFKVTFSTPGKYTYYCVIHPLMTGTVTVVDANGRADAQSEVDRRAEAEKARWLAEGQAAKKKLVEAPPVVQRAADGTSTYKVEMGATTEHTDVLAFDRPALDLKVGDRVTFVNNSQAPHTASFAGRTTLPQDPTSPAVERPAPGPSPQTLNPTDFFNTGLLPPNAGPPGSIPPEPARSFTFVVRTPGNYTYVCILHVPSGMGGSLKVA